MASPKLIIILLIAACLSLVLAAPLPVDRRSLQKRCDKQRHEHNAGYSRDDDSDDREDERKERENERKERDNERKERDNERKERDNERKERDNERKERDNDRQDRDDDEEDNDDDDEEDRQPKTTETEEWHQTTTTQVWEPTTTTTKEPKPTQTTTTEDDWEPTTTTKKSKPTHTTTTEDEWEPTTTTHKAKPTTTTEDDWEPTTTTKSKTTTTTEKAEPTDDGNSGGGSGDYSGQGTWYGVGLGSCGQTNSDSEYVAALNYAQMENGGNPNNNPKCGNKIRINGPSGSVTVTIVDTCPTCAYGDIDLSPAAFTKIADLDDGRVSINWSFA